jgi:hypothetical protein
MEFLQQVSEFAVGAHFPFKQHFATSLPAVPTEKHPKGLRSRTTNVRLTAM